MASAQSSADSTVPQLMASVMQLTPAELREFKRRFAKWQQEHGGQADNEAALIQACKSRLTAADDRRLNKLIAKSERESLSADELEDYRTLVRKSERLDATRLAALTQLATQWGKPVRAVMRAIGWEGGEDEAASHPARAAKTGARPSR
jgi:hypothetical protein